MSSELDDQIAQLRRLYRPAPLDSARFDHALRRRIRRRRVRNATAAVALIAVAAMMLATWAKTARGDMPRDRVNEVARAVEPTFDHTSDRAGPALGQEPITVEVAVAHVTVEDRFAASVLQTGLDYGDLPPGYGALYSLLAAPSERGNP